LTATVNKWLHPNTRAATDVHGSDALWAVNLVTTERHGVDVQILDVDRQLAQRLSRVSVKEDLLLATEFANSFDRLHHTDLVVDEHHRN